MRIKPLILLIPFIIICIAAMEYDKPIEQETVKEEQNVAPIIIDLVVGQAGSLTNDIGLPIYEECTQTSKRVGELQYNCCVIEDKHTVPEDGWISVRLIDETGNEYTAYVKEDNVIKKRIRVSSDNPTRMKLISNSLSYIGVKFIVGGTNLTEGVDCSNFINLMYKDVGLSIPSTPNEIKKASKSIPLENLEPGDILYYDVNDGGGHVGMYLADGYTIGSMGHSGKTYPEGGVRIVALTYRDRPMPEALTIF